MKTESNDAGLFKHLVEKHKFSIPPYQRAYAWKEAQVEQLLKDLGEHAAMLDTENKNYYLGHFILEENNGSMEIVDGQQRLTSIALLYAACKKHKKIDAGAYPSINLQVQGYDNDFFQALLKNEQAPKAKTSSQERMKKVFQYINKYTQEHKVDTASYLKVLYNAYVSIAVYHNKSVAAQIFELHNTRGVPLSEIEKVKAALMKYVYNFSTDSEKDINEIQHSFAKVFELEEKSREASFRGEMNLDHILMYHLRAMDNCESKEKDFFTPWSASGDNGCFAYVKKRLNAFQKEPSKGVEYAKALAKELSISMNLVCNTLTVADEKNPLVGDVLLLDQHHSMVFLLRYFRALPNGSDSGELDLLLKRWEAFLLMWDWHGLFHNMKSPHKHSFHAIYKKLVPIEHREVSDLLFKYYAGGDEKSKFAARPYGKVLGKVFEEHLQSQQILHTAYRQHGGKIRYILYKYELSVANDEKKAREALRHLFKEDQLSLEHIVAREISWEDCGRSEKPSKGDWDWWENKMMPVLDSIGNLLILNRSTNSAAGNDSLKDKKEIYLKKGLDFGSYKLAEWSVDSAVWEGVITKREQKIHDFVLKYFTDKKTWAKA